MKTRKLTARYSAQHFSGDPKNRAAITGKQLRQEFYDIYPLIVEPKDVVNLFNRLSADNRSTLAYLSMSRRGRHLIIAALHTVQRRLEEQLARDVQHAMNAQQRNTTKR